MTKHTIDAINDEGLDVVATSGRAVDELAVIPILDAIRDRYQVAAYTDLHKVLDDPNVPTETKHLIQEALDLLEVKAEDIEDLIIDEHVATGSEYSQKTRAHAREIVRLSLREQHRRQDDEPISA